MQLVGIFLFQMHFSGIPAPTEKQLEPCTDWLSQDSELLVCVLDIKVNKAGALGMLV